MGNTFLRYFKIIVKSVSGSILRGFFLAVFFVFSYTFAQKPNFNFRQITLADGINCRTVRSVCQDKDGYIWIGSSFGVNRFNGKDFISYSSSKEDSFSLSFNNVWKVFCDSRNNIWAGGLSGIDLYDHEHDRFVKIMDDTVHPNNLNNPNCVYNRLTLAFFEDHAGSVWMGGWEGISRYDHKTKKFLHIKPALKDKNVRFIRAIGEDKHHNIWIGTDEGFFKYSPTYEFIKQYRYPNQFAENNANRTSEIVLDKNGTLWLSSWGGLYRYDDRNDSFKTFKFFEKEGMTIQASQINSMTCDSKGNFWLGGEYGLVIFDPSTGIFNRYIDDQHSNIASQYITCMYQDREQGIWIGTQNSGINYINFHQLDFNFYKLPRINDFTVSSNANNIMGIWEDTKQNVYLRTVDYKNFYWDRKNRSITPVLFEPPLFQDSKGYFWNITGTYAVRSRPDGSSVSRYALKISNQPSETGVAISQDFAGKIWVLADGRIANSIDTLRNAVTSYELDTLVPDSYRKGRWVCFVADKNRNLWFFNECFFRVSLADKSCKTYSKSDIFGSYYDPGYTCTDSYGHLWFCSSGAGISYYDHNKDSIIRITRHEGLSSNFTQCVVEDKNNNIWILTDNGLTFFNSFTQKIRTFSASDGLQSDVFSQGAISTSDGIVIFGGNRGFNAFDPDSIRPMRKAPNVIISHFKIFNQEVIPGENSVLKNRIEETKEIVLNYDQSVLTFEFNVLSYVDPQKNEYAYKMEPFETKYNFVKTLNKANYTNLNPGTYVFSVIGANADGIWNHEGTSIKIIILPPFWKTLWFRISAVLFLILAIYLIFYLRTRNLANQKKMLTRMVDEQTEELRSQAEELRATAETLQETNVQMEEKQEEILSQKEELEHQAQELVRLNVSKDKLFSIIGHDLKNPFYAIHGMASMLQSEVHSMPDEQKAEVAGMIKVSSEGATSLLENLLLWSRTQSGKMAISPESFDLHDIAETTCVLLNLNAKNKGLALINSIPVRMMVHADKNMITTVIRNLVNNAIKFTSAGSITISAEDNGDLITVSVTDTGIGMDETTRKKLFMIDVHHTTKGTSGEAGTGLGLIICMEFVEANNGEIWVNSTVGQGSSFNFSLPKK